jgi:hypothetical protein
MKFPVLFSSFFPLLLIVSSYAPRSCLISRHLFVGLRFRKVDFRERSLSYAQPRLVKTGFSVDDNVITPFPSGKSFRRRLSKIDCHSGFVFYLHGSR